MLSIIVPVYNADAFLSKNVKSILSQAYKDFELILVNDGSKDKSTELCNEFKRLDNRVRVIHKENGGVSSARNRGLDVAQGEYIMFIDADDWIESDFCKNLMHQIEKFDLIVGGYKILNSAGIQEQKFGAGDLEFPKQFENKFDELYAGNFFHSPFSKVYKRDIIGDQRFDLNVVLGEDFLFNLAYISKCKKIKIVDETGYIYNCMNEEAATKKIRDNDAEQVVFLYQMAQRFVKTYFFFFFESREVKKRLCLNGINLIQLICYSQKSNDEKKKLAKKLLTNSDFTDVCGLEFHLPLKYEIPQKLCAKKKWIELKMFFAVKRKLSAIKRS